MGIIENRVSIRKYQDRPVEQEKIEALLHAAMSAPSAINQQPWEFYVTTDPEKLLALSQGAIHWRCLAGAKLAIVPCIQRDCRLMAMAPTDLALAVENLWLKAVELGLGAVMLGTYPLEERERAIAEVLGVPDVLIPYTIMSIGYPDETRQPQDRYEESRVHYV